MSFSLSAVSFILEGLAVAGAGAVTAGAVVWADTVGMLLATINIAAIQTLVRSMGISSVSCID
jgi:hypothetical protein